MPERDSSSSAESAVGSSAFYGRFERHGSGEGLEAWATHYCPGCGHGLVQKYLAEAIEDLGVQDRTVAVSPVGCAVFMYWYLDVGNTQAAHGRAPAVAVGHKTANPDAIVVSYQGDGDLAAIGLAEILHAAQTGLPLTVLFVNNAVYGMTGGQMAPTTLMHQRTTTTPDGRTRMAGEPLKVAEMIAGLDGPVYVERVALYDNKQRMRARKAIHRALSLQVENRGFAFVEILAECPTHLGVAPPDAERWVKEAMVPVFPLGVKKDVDLEPWYEPGTPDRTPESLIRILDLDTTAAPASTARFPAHLDPSDVAIKLAGAGGDGVQTLGRILCRVGIGEGWDATWIPSYGPESRGGTSFADVHLALDEVLSPSAPRPDVLVAFNAPSLAKFGPDARPGAVVLWDSTVVAEVPEGVAGRGIPFGRIAFELGDRRVKNMVALGALEAATGLLPAEALRSALPEGPLNAEAFEAGRRAWLESETEDDPSPEARGDRDGRS